jgi:hypothetical protein
MQSLPIHHVVDGTPFLIYETVLDDKHLYTACGVGRVEGSNAHLADSGRQQLGALLSYLERTPGGAGTIRFQEIATVAVAPVRVRKTLAAAGNREAVFFVCRGPDIYDAALAALNIDFSPRQQDAGGTAQR